MLELYLHELQRELACKLSGEEAEALLSEARNHLEQSIQARLELGSTQADAEREALASFGRRETLVERLPDPPRVRLLVLRLWGFAAATLAIMASTLLFLRTGWVWLAPAPLLTIGLLAAGSLALGFRARRPVPVPLFLGGLVASLGFIVMLGFVNLNLSRYGGSATVFRWDAGETVRASLTRSTPPVPMRTWTKRDAQGRVATYEEVRGTHEYEASDLAAISQAEADPLGNALSQTGTASSDGMVLASIAGAFDLIGAGLGWLWLRRRQRRPTLA